MSIVHFAQGFHNLAGISFFCSYSICQVVQCPGACFIIIDRRISVANQHIVSCHAEKHIVVRAAHKSVIAAGNSEIVNFFGKFVGISPDFGGYVGERIIFLFLVHSCQII